MLKTAGVAALGVGGGYRLSSATAAAQSRPHFEGKDTPKICLEVGLAAPAGVSPEEAAAGAARRIRQLGVEHVLSGGGRIPWEESRLKEMMDRLKVNGVTLANLMISGFPNAIYNRPDRDADIEKVIQSIKAAGRVGLPVVEYNWYAHRAMEGYFEETGRANAGWTGFDYERMKGLPPLEEEGAHTLDEMWANITYFLKAVVPEAEKAGVRLALHPNDPPAPISRGSQQIMVPWTVRTPDRLLRPSNFPSGPLFHRHLDFPSIGTSKDAKSHFRPYFRLRQQSMQVVEAGNDFIVQRNDEVAIPEASRQGRPVWLERNHQHSGRLTKAVKAGHPAQEWHILAGDSEIATADTSVAQKRRQDRDHSADGYCEAEALPAGDDRGIDADDAAVARHEWSARVAGIERRVGLNDLIDQAP